MTDDVSEPVCEGVCVPVGVIVPDCEDVKLGVTVPVCVGVWEGVIDGVFEFVSLVV